MTLEELHARARKARSRWLMRRREYHERELASGVWVELRRELALTERAIAIDEATALALERAGHAPVAAGLRLSSKIRAYVVTRSELPGMPQGDDVPLRIEALAQRPAVVLVRFDVAAGR